MMNPSKRASGPRLAALLLSLLLLLPFGGPLRAGEAEEPFRLTAELLAEGTLSLRWDIAPGHKLYRDQIRLELESGEAVPGAPVLPEGEPVVDPLTGERSVAYHDSLDCRVAVTGAKGPYVLRVWHQGCADGGVCFPPESSLLRVDPARPGPVAVERVPVTFGVVPVSPAAVDEPVAAEGDSTSAVARTLAEGSLWKVAGAFLIFGLLLSLTPCILPMLPILSSIIAGEERPTRLRGFLLAFVYSAGMAVVYTAVGVAAGLAGEGLSGFLQQPPVLIGFSLLLVLLSLSMFDLYQLQIPASLQARLNAASGRMRGGRFPGVFVMGAISALVVGPCVAAPLAGTLVYISRTGDVVQGGLALFSMAMGMSVPLLLLGLSAGFLLPKAGGWMQEVKHLFGALLVAVAIYMASPVLPPALVLVAWGALFVLSAWLLGLFRRDPAPRAAGSLVRRALAFASLLLACSLFVGAATGARSPLDPFAGLRGGEDRGGLAFREVRSEAELDSLLRAAGRPAMLDVTADWCVSCRRLEAVTFRDPRVLRATEGMLLLRLDVSANGEEERRLMKRFGVFGPPALIFFDEGGEERTELRTVGFVGPDELLGRLQRP
ncbi:protein-disulfide reductase DsbD [Chlorobium sp. N1]|uniref:protein-disulfide reductase DsbD n=1 Tax=Chlorobium sp. N1 TaxID=2491138 RepID=UPI00103DEF91|nr:protein-disulfide reductase DsbD [Chlorobium sp. N1]TCD47241.1 protein-disulfide reductase DsbD [Chlorobium sp. N1]